MIATIDDVKKYWDDRPCNVRHSDKEIGTKQYFDEVERKRYTAEPHIPAFADFSKWKGKKVLEIGCGLGTEAINFAKHGADYTGTDLSIESLNLAQNRFKVYNQEGRFFQGNAENLSSFLNSVLILNKSEKSKESSLVFTFNRLIPLLLQPVLFNVSGLNFIALG